MQMTFGRFEGTEVEDLEDWYLTWLYEDATVYDKDLLSEISDEYYERSLGL